jgi:hypothetical protein
MQNIQQSLFRTTSFAILFLACFPRSASAEELLKEDFSNKQVAEERWILSADTGEAEISPEGIKLSGSGFPSARTNQASNFNDDGSKTITYEVDYSIDSGLVILWLRMDEIGVPSGAALLEGGSNAVQGYRLDIDPNSGKGRVCLSRHVAGQPGMVLWQNDPAVGAGTDLREGTASVELKNEGNSVVISVSINGNALVSWVDDAPERIESGVGVGISAFSPAGDAALQVRSVKAAR